jgi:hypothetical protein
VMDVLYVGFGIIIACTAIVAWMRAGDE